MATKVALLAGLLFAAACANDTGRPRLTTGDGFFDNDPSSSPVLTPPTLPAVPVGMTMMGSAGATGTAGARAPSCLDARAAASGIVPAECIDCTCRLRPQETSECDEDCWRLLVCGTSKCDPSDVNCLLAKCAQGLGSNIMLAIAGASARATPFMECASVCIVADDHEETGPRGNDF